MPITITCSGCQKTYRLRDELAGKVAKCHCGQTITVPQPHIPVQQPAPVAQPAAPAAPASAPDASLDPFAGISDEAVAQPSPLQPLASTGKRRRKQGINPLLILAIGGGSVVAILVIAMVVVMMSGGNDQVAASPKTPPPAPPSAAAPAPAAPAPVAAPKIRWNSPEEVYEAHKKALADRDWRTRYETFGPRTRRRRAGMLGVLAVWLSPRCPPIREVYEEYEVPEIDLKLSAGLPPMSYADQMGVIRKHMDKLGGKVDDEADFYTDMMETVFDEGTPDLKGILGTIQMELGIRAYDTLEDVKIDGDKATGRRVTSVKGQPMKEPLDFVKVDGEWRMEENIVHF